MWSWPVYTGEGYLSAQSLWAFGSLIKFFAVKKGHPSLLSPPQDVGFEGSKAYCHRFFCHYEKSSLLWSFTEGGIVWHCWHDAWEEAEFLERYQNNRVRTCDLQKRVLNCCLGDVCILRRAWFLARKRSHQWQGKPYKGEERFQDRETVFRALPIHSLGMSLHGQV